MTQASFVIVGQRLIGRDRKDPDSEPEQGLSLVPRQWGCWGLRVLTLKWGSWPDSGLAVYMLQVSLGWEASGLKRTFQEPQVGISDSCTYSRGGLTPTSQFAQFSAPISSTYSCKTVPRARAAQTPSPSSGEQSLAEGSLGVLLPLGSVQLSCLHLLVACLLEALGPPPAQLFVKVVYCCL